MGRSNRKRDSSRKNLPLLTEDEADNLYAEKRKHENGIPWDQVKAKLDAIDR